MRVHYQHTAVIVYKIPGIYTWKLKHAWRLETRMVKILYLKNTFKNKIKKWEFLFDLNELVSKRLHIKVY